MRVVLTGGSGMLGRSIVDRWAVRRPDDELVTVDLGEVDLRDRVATRELFDRLAPDAVIHAAAKVGGIAAKLAAPTSYLLDNLLLDVSVIGAALDVGVPSLLSVSSAVIYPQRYERPFVESDLMAGPLEPANEGYGLAKIASTKLCGYASQERGLSYRVAVPSNLYGPHDHFTSPDAHLVAAALVKVHRAHVEGIPDVSVWGDGTARREFTYAVDLADWLVGQVDRLQAWPAMLNLGCGVDHTVGEYYELAREIVGYGGVLAFEPERPSGVPRRLIDSSAARALGWDPATTLNDGMAQSYTAYLALLADNERHDD